jgi:transposase
MKGKPHSAEVREAVVNDVKAGMPQKDAAAKHRVSISVVAKWANKKRRGPAKQVDGIKALSKHRNIKEARLLLEEFRNLVPDIRKVTRRDLLALLALTELEQIP